MKVTLRATTGAKILVWQEDGTFRSQRAQASGDPQACPAMDLFEVIAELAGLDLDEGRQAAEAMTLADDAQRRLRAALVSERERPAGV